MTDSYKVIYPIFPLSPNDDPPSYQETFNDQKSDLKTDEKPKSNISVSDVDKIMSLIEIKVLDILENATKAKPKPKTITDLGSDIIEIDPSDPSFTLTRENYLSVVKRFKDEACLDVGRGQTTTSILLEAFELWCQDYDLKCPLELKDVRSRYGFGSVFSKLVMKKNHKYTVIVKDDFLRKQRS